MMQRFAILTSDNNAYAQNSVFRGVRLIQVNMKHIYYRNQYSVGYISILILKITQDDFEGNLKNCQDSNLKNNW